MNTVTVPWYEFNWFDYLIIAIVSVSVIVSFFRGFVREAISLSIWATGLILAFKFAPLLAQRIHPVMHWQMLSYGIAFAVIFLSVWIVGLLFSLAIRAIVSRVGLGFADRMIGVCFGVLRGVLVVAVLLAFVSLSPYKDSQSLAASRLTPAFHRVIVLLDHYIPVSRHHQSATHWAMEGRV